MHSRKDGEEMVRNDAGSPSQSVGHAVPVPSISFLHLDPITVCSRTAHERHRAPGQSPVRSTKS